MHNLTTMSESQKADYSEELIGLHIKTSLAGDNKFYILPVFKMNNETKRNKLDIFENIDVIVDESTYNEFDLDVRPLYVSTDSADKRPFVYYGAIEPFGGSNKKTFLIDLIAKPQNGCLAIVKDSDDYNLKLSNIDIVDRSTKPPVHFPKNKAKQTKLPIVGEEDGKPFLPKLDIVETRTIKKLIEDGEIITSNDAARDKTWKWHGVSKVSGENKWTAKCKSVHLGTFGHPLDAARAYNNFVIDNELPHAVNNIPGFLKMKFIDLNNEFSLSKVQTYKLAEMIVLRTKPKETDG